MNHQTTVVKQESYVNHRAEEKNTLCIGKTVMCIEAKNRFRSRPPSGYTRQEIIARASFPRGEKEERACVHACLSA